MTILLRWYALALGLFGFGFGLLSDPVGSTNSIRVLFLGNSYTYYDDIPWQLAQLSSLHDHRGRRIEADMVVAPGATLAHHLLSEDVRQKLAARTWDFVVLQEQSQASLKGPRAMAAYLKALNEHIQKAGGRPLLFLIWPYARNPENTDLLAKTYSEAARSIDAAVAPVGIAWRLALKEDPSLKLYDQDGSHPAPTGSLLAACVFYSTIFHERPPNSAMTLWTRDGSSGHKKAGKLSKTQAKAIRNAAWSAVQSWAQTAGDPIREKRATK